MKSLGLFPLLLTSIFFSSGYSQKAGIRSSIALGCWNSASRWNFGCTNSTLLNVGCQCQNHIFLGSVLDCINDQSNGDYQIQQGYRFVQDNCQYNGDAVIISFSELDRIYEHQEPTIKAPKYVNGSKDLQTLSVDIPESTFLIDYRAAAAAKRQYALGTILGTIMVAYWVLIIVINSFDNFLSRVYPDIVYDTKQIWFITYFRKVFTLPALFGFTHGRPLKIFHWSIKTPTRGQFFVLFGYITLNAVFLAFWYDTYTPNTYIHSKSMQILRYLGNRAGIMAFTQLPLVIVFASRNNFMLFFTGWSYDTFQVYHRWVATIMTVHALIHGVCFSWIAIVQGQYIYKWHTVINWKMGHVAIISALIMILLAPFRGKFYEMFSFSHKIFFLVFMAGIYRHCSDFGWMGWVYASIALYGFERCCRAFNIILSGISSKGRLELFADNTFRVSVNCRHRWNIRPGAYIYIRILTRDMFWQNHPFSVYQSPIKTEEGKLQLAIKERNGATKKIADFLRTQPGHVANLPIMIEGPYGTHAPVDNHKTVILVAGGMGITAIYSYAHKMKDLAKTSNQRMVLLWVIPDCSPLDWFGDEILSLMSYDKFMVHVYITQKMLLNPVEPDVEDDMGPESSGIVFEDSDGSESEDASVEKISKLQKPSKSELKVHEQSLEIPALHSEQSSSTTTGGSVSTSSFKPHPASPTFCSMKARAFSSCLKVGRPNLKVEIGKYLKEAEGSIAVISCGPPLFVDIVRRSIVKNINRSDARVDYFEEAFSW